MNSEERVEFAFCWYEPEEWERLKLTAVDVDKLDDSYEEWKINANSAIGEIRAQGQVIRKISVKMDEFLRWCQEKNLENNSEARSQYAAEILQKRKGET